MATKIKLISEDYIKQNSNLPDNVNMDNIDWAIFEAQDIYIEQKIGTDLINKIYNLIDTNTITGTTYQTLLDEYIVPSLVWATLFYASIHIWARPTNKSVQKGTSDYSENLDLKEFQYWRDLYKTWMNDRLDRLYNYLCYNSTLYPEFTSNSDGDDIIPDDYDDCYIIF